jgi:choline-sulfatase
MMKRRDIVKAAVASSLLPTFGSAQQALKPDILFISIDDLNDWIEPFQFNGAGPAVPRPFQPSPGALLAPHLNAFAQRSTVFQRAYAPSIVCGASRSAILSGIAPHRSGVLNNENIFDLREKCALAFSEGPLLPGSVRHQGSIAKWLKAAGYVTGLCGKVYHGAGYNENIWLQDAGAIEKSTWDHYSNIDYRDADLSQGRCTENARTANDISAFSEPNCTTPLESFFDVEVKDWAIQKLSDISSQAPIFLALGFVKPHTRWQAPVQYFNEVSQWLVNAPARSVEIALASGDPLGSCVSQLRRANEPTATNWDRSLRIATQAYLACTRFVDELVGQVVAAADQRRLATGRRQIIVVWSDHGFVLGTRQGFAKQKFLDRAARSPVLIFDSAKPLTSAQHIFQPISTIDLFPTILEYAQVAEFPTVPDPAKIDGQSLKPFVDSGSRGNALDLITSFNFRQLWGQQQPSADLAQCAAERGVQLGSLAGQQCFAENTKNNAHPARQAGASYSIRYVDIDGGDTFRYSCFSHAGLVSSPANLSNEYLTSINPSTLEESDNLLSRPNAADYQPLRAYLRDRLANRIHPWTLPTG